VNVIAVSAGDLVQVVVVSLVAGLGVTVVFAVAIVGAIHAKDAHRERRHAARAAWGGISLAALLGVAAAVLAGLWVVAS
jgi:hypothetical protein